MNFRTILVTLFLICSLAIASYGAITLKTYNEGSATASATDVVKKDPMYDDTIGFKQNDNGTSTGQISWNGGIREPIAVIPITETAIASASTTNGNLYFYWDTSALQLKIKYKNATGTAYVGSFTFATE